MKFDICATAGDCSGGADSEPRFLDCAGRPLNTRFAKFYCRMFSKIDVVGFGMRDVISFSFIIIFTKERMVPLTCARSS